MDYSNENRGVLFRNDKKESEKHPDFTGSIDVGGVDHYLSGWIKESKQGKKFFSLSVKAKDAVAKPAIQQAKQAIDEDFDDMSIPF
jgi:uncharacterized protein (DUF736 family)